MWNNPLASQGQGGVDNGKSPKDTTDDLSSGTLDEAAERRKFQEAVAEWRNGGKPKRPDTNEASAGTSATDLSTRTASATLARNGASHFDGTPDEAGEHERFRRAVRNGGGRRAERARHPGGKACRWQVTCSENSKRRQGQRKI